MPKLIKHNIDIVTFTSGPTSLVSVVNPSYYHRVFNEVTGTVSDEFLFLGGPVAEKSLVGRMDWFGVTVNLLPHLELFIYSKTTSLLVVSTNAYGIIFYQIDLLPWLTFSLFGVIFGFWITSTSLSGNVKVCCDCLNYSFPD